MVRVVDCHTGVLGSNLGGPKIFSPWNYFSAEVCILGGHMNYLADSTTKLCQGGKGRYVGRKVRKQWNLVLVEIFQI